MKICLTLIRQTDDKNHFLRMVLFVYMYGVVRFPGIAVKASILDEENNKTTSSRPSKRGKYLTVSN